MSDTFKVGDRVRWVGEHESPSWDDQLGREGDTGTVVRVDCGDVLVRVDRLGQKWVWPVENTAKLTTPSPDTITIDTFTLTLDQARRAGEAAAQAEAEKKAAAEGRVVVISCHGTMALRVPYALIQAALDINPHATHLYLWANGTVGAHRDPAAHDTLLLDTPELFERLRG